MAHAPRPPPTDDSTNQRICVRLVQREVRGCVSSLISHFAENPGALRGSDYTWEDDIVPLCSQDDWRATWEGHHATGAVTPAINSPIEDFHAACEQAGIDTPLRSEAYEHWNVSEWFGGRLAARGEMVGELFGMTVWGRTTTGQAISLDNVIVAIAEEMGVLVGQPYEWTL